MGYIGRGPVKSGAFRIIDDIASGFDGSDVTFTLQHNSSNITPGTEQNLMISVDGVMQEPIDAFTISGSVLTFTSAPASGASFWGVELGDVGGIAANIADGIITTAKLSSGVLDTDISSVSGSDDTVASAKAIKTYVDAQVATENQISEMNDVTLSSIGSGELLKWNGSAWINQTLAEAGITGGPSQANQAAIEAQTNQDTYVPPDLLHHHPGVAKVRWNGNSNIATMVEHESYGMDSFTDNGVGDHTFTFDTAFSSINFSWFASLGHIAGELSGGMTVNQYDVDASPRTTTTLRLDVKYGHYSPSASNHLFNAVDCNELDLIVFGDQ